MYGSAGLCMEVQGYLWRYRAKYLGIGLCMEVHDCVWRYRAMNGATCTGLCIEAQGNVLGTGLCMEVQD